MKKIIFKLVVFSAVTVSLAFLGGCKSKNPNGMDDWDDTEGLIVGDSIEGSMLNDSMGLPADGDRSLFPPVFFAYDSSQVNPEEAGKCEEVAKYLNKGKCEGVIVEGHGDERGSREYNLALGERRALAVRDYLISLGVDPAVIQTKSYGEEMPDNMGHDEAAWRQNRRVVFAIY
ncbi:MAG: OmpA family protein [Kiritimatiellaceae bacterium]|nr:OmpA family protein [Kiritimatiellaceae bacterium]